MKKLLYLMLFVCGMATTLFAQLPDGSTAPNFTSRDINGKEWDLYEILETGRPVILDISATWCGPCWSYHNSGNLKNYFNTYGPPGTGESMVLFVEGDGDTNEACLYGPTGCVGGTAGNWVANTPYPIINDERIFSAYDGAYFPTMFTVFPDKTLIESGQLSTAAHWNIAQQHTSGIEANRIGLRKMESGSLSQQICNPQEATPKVAMRNMGKSALTAATFELQWNGQVLQTKDWTGNVPVFGDFELAFDKVSIPSGGTLAVVAKFPNGDLTASTRQIVKEYIDAPQVYTSSTVQMRLITDNAGAYTYWAMLDQDGNILQDGGNTAVGLNGGGQYAGVAAPASTTAYGNFKTINITLNTPADGSCFSIVVVDGAGDGFFGPGRYQLSNPGVSQPFFTMSEKFTTHIGHTFAAGVSGTQTPAAVQSLKTFPNPATDLVKVEFETENSAAIQLTVANAVGQKVFTVASQLYAQGRHQVEIPVEELPTGIYFLHLQNELGGVTTRQFAVTH